jgi:NADPH2:quinone reductase
VKEILQLTNNHGVDRVIEVDFGANLNTDAQILRPGGICVMYAVVKQPELPLPVMTLMVKNITYKFTMVYSISEIERHNVLTGISRWLSETTPIFNIAARFDLQNIVQAHELVESGKKIGHVILNIPH